MYIEYVMTHMYVRICLYMSVYICRYTYIGKSYLMLSTIRWLGWGEDFVDAKLKSGVGPLGNDQLLHFLQNPNPRIFTD